MTAHNIFETISSQYFQLTNSEKKVADYEAHSIDIVAVVTLVNKSHATQEEKQAILDALYGRTKKAEETKTEQ